MLIAVIAGVFALWYTGKFDGLLSDQNAPVVQSVAVGSTTPQTDDTEAAVETSMQSVENTSSDVGQDAAITPEADQETGETVEEEALAQRVGHVLTLDFNDTCWVDIRDSDGKRLAYKSYAGGEQLEVQSELPITVFLGKADAVTAKVNGDDFDLAPHREGVFARFSIGE